MVYSNTTTKDGIIQHIETMCDLGDAYISGTTANLRYFNGIINRVQSRVWHLIHQLSGNWSYDDASNTDLPVATTNLASGTGSYALPSDALTVKRIEIKDENDNWYKLKPLVEEQIGIAINEYNDINGTPYQYTLKDGVVQLFPAPNYTKNDALKVYYDRGAVEFTYNDTTATPGIASPYHEIIPIGASIEWYKIKQPQSQTLQGFIQDYIKLEQSIKEHYGKRFKNYKPRVSRAYQSYK